MKTQTDNVEFNTAIFCADVLYHIWP